MKLSVITVNLNNRDGLQKTIDSVVAQTFGDFEWIVIDGGSTDGSRELIERFSDRMAYWVSEPDSGIFNGMNKGIRVSHGEYLLFLNSGDTFVDAQTLEHSVRYLHGKDLYIGDSKTERGVDELDLSSREKTVFTLLRRGFPHQSIFYNKTVFERFGCYREDLKTCADWVVNIWAVIFNDAEVEKLPFVVSVFESGGISMQRDVVAADVEKLMAGHKNLSHVFGFYIKWFSLIERIHGNRLLLNLGRRFAAMKKWV